MAHEPARRWQRALRNGLAPDTLRMNVAIAVVVGTFLVLINQWNALFGDSEFRIFQAVLTYLVPWLVSTWVTVQREMSTDTPDDS